MVNSRASDIGSQVEAMLCESGRAWLRQSLPVSSVYPYEHWAPGFSRLVIFVRVARNAKWKGATGR